MLERGLTLDFVRVTEAAALASGYWQGRGDKMAADDAAVRGMRAVFDTIPINGTVVIGEGEMDEAPMLYIGEPVGNAKEPLVDIAVDPLEGTNLVAKGASGAIAVLAAGEKGGLLHAPDMYMDKICVGPKAKGKIQLDASVTENMNNIAKALDKHLCDLTVVVLDRERHQPIIDELRKCGCRIQLITDGDVAPAVACAIPGSGIDVMIGIGGAPEGVIAAAALKCLGGDMQGRLWPEDDEDRQRMAELGVADDEKLLTLEDMAAGEEIMFAATGISTGPLLRGVVYDGVGATTHSLVLRAKTGTMRFVETIHDFSKKPLINIITKDVPGFAGK
ncbi:MAG: class II fructose-bisphosphatase [Clostridiales bacterium]